MKIYVSHSRLFDFKQELYVPLSAAFSDSYQLILPHAHSELPYPSRELFTSRACDIVLAEVSYPSIGLGIELGWASAMGIPIYAIHASTAKVSGSISVVTQQIISYRDSDDLVNACKNLFDGLKNNG